MLIFHWDFNHHFSKENFIKSMCAIKKIKVNSDKENKTLIKEYNTVFYKKFIQFT